MKLVKKELKKEQNIASFGKTYNKNHNGCGDDAGFGPNPTGSENAAANYNKNNGK